MSFSWTRAPVVSYNQAGYTPGRSKVPLVELDPRYDAPKTARVLRLDAAGNYSQVYQGCHQAMG